MSDYSDIQAELDDFKNAVYGEEVRDSMISAIKKIHDTAESAAGAPDASSATAGQVLTADGAGGWQWGDVASGSGGQPTPVTSASDMVDTEKLYLYLGNESGYQYGYIYAYINGAWTSTGLYGRGQAGANGADGYSPTATVTQTATGVSISITDKDGTTTASVENGTATQEQVDSWLDEHPEATTTVQDGSITSAKLATSAFDNTLSINGKIADAKVVGDKGSKLESAINVIDNGIYELTNVPLDSVIWGNAQHTRIQLRLGALDETLLRVISAPSTIKISVTAWTSAGYATKVFDSGWVAYPYSTVIDNTLYYMISFAKSDFSEFASLTDIDDAVIVKLKSRIDLMDATLTTLGESVDNVNDILYEQSSIDLNSLYFIDANKKNIRMKLDRFYDGGELIVKNLPDNVQIAIDGYSGKNYATRVTQSGWQKSTPFKLTVNKDLYYLIAFAKYDWGAFDSLNEVANARLNIVSSVKPKIDNATPLTSLTVRSIAHRGDITIAPQNTAPSYILARKEGHTIAENDVWVSADGEYVMEHDTSLSRLGDLVDINGYEMYTDGSTFYYYDTDNSQLYTYTTDYVASSIDVATLTRCNGANYAVTGLMLAVLKRIDFGVYKGRQFKGTQILTFAEWILLMKQLGMDAYIDRKIGYTPTIATELANIVKAYGMLDHVSWIGVPTSNLIEAIRAVDPKARIGVLEHPNSTNIVTYAPYNTGRGFFFNGNAKDGLTKEAVQIGINAGFDVETYYVGYDYPTATESEIFTTISNAISYGVTGMSLDHYRVDDAISSMLSEYHIR